MKSNDKAEFIEHFRNREKRFVVDNITFFRSLPKTEEAKIVGRQLLARSKAEFHYKLSIVV